MILLISCFHGYSRSRQVNVFMIHLGPISQKTIFDSILSKLLQLGLILISTKKPICEYFGMLKLVPFADFELFCLFLHLQFWDSFHRPKHENNIFAHFIFARTNWSVESMKINETGKFSCLQYLNPINITLQYRLTNHFAYDKNCKRILCCEPILTKSTILPPISFNVVLATLLTLQNQVNWH